MVPHKDHCLDPQFAVLVGTKIAFWEVKTKQEVEIKTSGQITSNVPGSKLPMLGMFTHLTFNDGILIMGPYKPRSYWVDEFIPYYMQIMGF